MNASSCEKKFGRIKSDVCSKYETALYCEMIKDLSEKASIGTEALTNLLDVKFQADLTAKSRENFVDKVTKIFNRKMTPYTYRMESGRNGCYFTQMRKEIDRIELRLRNEGYTFGNESIEEFAEQMESYQIDIRDYNQKISESYACVYEAGGGAECLDNFVMVSQRSFPVT